MYSSELGAWLAATVKTNILQVSWWSASSHEVFGEIIMTETFQGSLGPKKMCSRPLLRELFLAYL